MLVSFYLFVSDMSTIIAKINRRKKHFPYSTIKVQNRGKISGKVEFCQTLGRVTNEQRRFRQVYEFIFRSKPRLYQ